MAPCSNCIIFYSHARRARVVHKVALLEGVLQVLLLALHLQQVIIARQNERSLKDAVLLPQRIDLTRQTHRQPLDLIQGVLTDLLAHLLVHQLVALDRHLQQPPDKRLRLIHLLAPSQ